MKKIILTRRHWIILLIIAIFPLAFINSQTCTGNKVRVCRTCTGAYGTTYQECDCIAPNQVATWQATPCGLVPSNNGNHGGGNDGNGKGGYCDCATIFTSTARPFAESVNSNPVSSSTSIRLTLFSRGRISLKVFDLTGRVLATLADGFYEAGEHHMQWNSTNALAGTYFLWLQTPQGSQVKKLLVVK
jgi:hypothetical protein